jgi:hypothetical protein
LEILKIVSFFVYRSMDCLDFRVLLLVCVDVLLYGENDEKKEHVICPVI